MGGGNGYLVVSVDVGQEVYFYSTDIPIEQRTPDMAFASLSVRAAGRGSAALSLKFPQNINIARSNIGRKAKKAAKALEDEKKANAAG